MVPIRDVVIFPYTKVAFKIGRPSSVRALEQAMTGERNIFLATQHDATIDEPNAEQVYSVGTLGRILQAQRQDNGQIKVVVEGRERGQSVRVEQDDDGMFFAHVRKIVSTDESGFRTDGLLQKIHTLVEQFLRVSPDAYTDALHASLRGISAAQIADSMCSHLRISVEEKQDLLETFSVQETAAKARHVLEAEIEKRQLDRSIHSRTKKQMDKHQREYYLNEQIKAIHKELGRKDEKAELDDLKKKIEEAGMSEEASEKAMQEFSRLEAMPPMSAESTVSRTYLDWLINVPWQQRSDEINDLSEAEKTLNEDHYGLEKIKERILEFLAVRQLVKNPKGTILCFVGAPGVGKTSLGKSIANATGRKFGGATWACAYTNGNWIRDDREGPDGSANSTSAAFAHAASRSTSSMSSPSPGRKCSAARAAHGVLILGPRAVAATRELHAGLANAEIFRMTKGGKLIGEIFEGETINTQSMLAVEDYIFRPRMGPPGLGGLDALVARTDANAAALDAGGRPGSIISPPTRRAARPPASAWIHR